MRRELYLPDPVERDHPLNRNLLLWFIPHPVFITTEWCREIAQGMVFRRYNNASNITRNANPINNSWRALYCNRSISNGVIYTTTPKFNMYWQQGQTWTVFYDMTLFQMSTFWMHAVYIRSLNYGSNGYGIYLYDGKAGIYYRTSSFFPVALGSPLAWNQRHCVATRYTMSNGQSLKITINNRPYGTSWINGNGNEPLSTPPPSTPLNIGGMQSDTDGQMSLHTVRINGTGLTDSEISALYEENMKGYPNLLRWLTGRAYFLPLEEYGSGLLLAGKRNSLISPSIVV